MSKLPRLRITRASLAALLWLTACASPPEGPTPEAPGSIDIPYERFVLDNGLTLIVHEDHKAPIVAVNVWYHVGSKNEKPRKTGFAHLFEHLMFNGSENYNDDYFGPFDRVGATEMNGTTNSDRTNYFQNIPVPALDMALWMESDRMGHLLGAIDQAKLDEQRSVVQNEKRQHENQPYGNTYNLITENAYPVGHPYSWSTIGSMEDLEAATVDDVHEWFKDYYGAANATLVVAGDVKAEEVLAKVEKYFGDIPSGPPVSRHQAWIAKRTGTHRQITQDRVPQARLIKVWNIPEHDADDTVFLDLAAGVLSSGKTSRFYERLVYRDQIASDASAYLWPREIGGLFIIQATALPGTDLAVVEAAIDEEMARFLAKGPSQRELERIQVGTRASFVRGVERIGGFGGKSDILASSQVLGGSPDAYKRELALIADATPAQVAGAARRWLTDGVYVLEVHPFPEYSTEASGVDRSAGVPSGGEAPDVGFPDFERKTLSSGLEIIVARRPAVPVVDFSLLVNAGFAADQFASQGTASLTANMLDEGTTSRSALEISEDLQLLGAQLGTGSDLDMTEVSLSALRENLDASLEIFADVILNPAFDELEFQRLRQQQIVEIQREKATPRSMALRVFPILLYGSDHAYGIPFTGSGSEESVARLDTDELRDFHRTFFRPNNATLLVVGDTTMDEIAPKLEALFRGWEPGEVPEKSLPEVPLQPASSVYLMDRPGSLQSIIIAGQVAPPTANPDEPAIEIMNEVLGGSFTSRINMNLREDKGWAYGAHTFLVGARGQRPFMAHAPVQTDKTTQSMQEILRELRDIVGPRPPEEEEVSRAQDKRILTLPGRWETADSVRGSMSAIVRFGFEDDYWDLYEDRISALSVDEVAAAARNVVHPERLIWVVVGDRAKIEADVRAIGLGELHLLDANGDVIPQDDAP